MKRPADNRKTKAKFRKSITDLADVVNQLFIQKGELLKEDNNGIILNPGTSLIYSNNGISIIYQKNGDSYEAIIRRYQKNGK